MMNRSMRSLGALLLGGLAGLTIVSCAGRMETATRSRAAADFGCAEADVKVTQTNNGGLSGAYDAAGCGRSEGYLAQCSLFGICRVESQTEADAKQAEYARARAEAASRPPPPPASSSSHASSSSSPPPPKRDEPSAVSYPENCGFDSDCGVGVKCNSRRCANTGGSKCGFDSDCGGNGAKCNSGKCSTAPDGKCNFDSQCPGGKCNSGKCKF